MYFSLSALFEKYIIVFIDSVKKYFLIDMRGKTGHATVPRCNKVQPHGLREGTYVKPYFIRLSGR